MRTACIIGTFDGVHLGHQALIATAQSRAQRLVAVTFSPHPRAVLTGRSPPLLQSLVQRQTMLRTMGCDEVIVWPFSSEVAATSYRSFLQQVRLRVPFDLLVMGASAVLGQGRRGTLDQIAILGKEWGVEVVGLPPHQEAGASVSSQQLRHHLQAGELLAVERGLGRRWCLDGVVQRGQQRGRLLGFPTANIAIVERALPPLGVYVGRARHRGMHYPALINLGPAPTFAREEWLLEVHLLHFDGDLYGCELEVELHHFVRPQQRFESFQALQEQLQRDLSSAHSSL